MGIASRCGTGVRLKDEGRAVDRRVGMWEDMCVGSAMRWALQEIGHGHIYPRRKTTAS